MSRVVGGWMYKVVFMLKFCLGCALVWVVTKPFLKTNTLTTLITRSLMVHIYCLVVMLEKWKALDGAV